MAGVPIERVIERLFPGGDDESTYAILDGARSPGIFPLIAASRLASRCLYVGAIAPGLARVAPHLVRLSLAEPSTRALITQGWGES